MLRGPRRVENPRVSRGLGAAPQPSAWAPCSGAPGGGRALHHGQCFPILEWVTLGGQNPPGPGWPWATHARVLVRGQGAHGARGRHLLPSEPDPCSHNPACGDGASVLWWDCAGMGTWERRALVGAPGDAPCRCPACPAGGRGGAQQAPNGPSPLGAGSAMQSTQSYLSFPKASPASDSQFLYLNVAVFH